MGLDKGITETRGTLAIARRTLRASITIERSALGTRLQGRQWIRARKLMSNEHIEEIVGEWAKSYKTAELTDGTRELIEIFRSKRRNNAQVLRPMITENSVPLHRD